MKETKGTPVTLEDGASRSILPRDYCCLGWEGWLRLGWRDRQVTEVEVNRIHRFHTATDFVLHDIV